MLNRLKKINFSLKKLIPINSIGVKRFLLLFVFVGIAIFVPKIVFAFSIIDSIIAPPLMALINFLGRLTSFFIWLLVQVAQYNDFINSPAVSKGWILMRDIFNMFFVIILLVIAFATVLKIETYSYKRLMPVFIVSAVLINFSKLICGVIIDISQVLMLTFISAIQSAATADFVEIFGLTKMLELRDNIESGVVISGGEMFGALLLGLVMVLVALGVIMTMTLLLVARIVMIWFYVLLSPMAFMATILPGTKSYASQWWTDFIKQVIIGPVLAFFLWISFSVVSTGGSSGMIDSSSGNSATIGVTGEPSFIFNFLIGIAMLIGSLMMAQKMGVAGGKMVGGAVSKMKGMAIGKAKGVAKRAAKRVGAPLKKVGKGLAGAAVKAPLRGLKAGVKFGGKKLQKTGKVGEWVGKGIEKTATPIESIRQLKGSAVQGLQKRKQSRLERLRKGKGTIMDKAAQALSEEYDKSGGRDTTINQEIRRDKLEKRQKQAQSKHDDDVIVGAENDEAYALVAAERGLLKTTKVEKLPTKDNKRLEELKQGDATDTLTTEEQEEFEELTTKNEDLKKKAKTTTKNNERVERTVANARNKFASDSIIGKSFDDHLKKKGDANLAYNTFYKDNPGQLTKDIKSGDFGVAQLMKLDKDTTKDLGSSDVGQNILSEIKTEDFNKFAKSTDIKVQDKFEALFGDIKPEKIKEKDKQKLIDAGRADLAFVDDPETEEQKSNNKNMVKKLEMEENRDVLLKQSDMALKNDVVAELVVKTANLEDIQKMSPKRKENLLEEKMPAIMKNYQKKESDQGLEDPEKEDYKKIQTTYIKAKKGKDISKVFEDKDGKFDESKCANLSKWIKNGTIKSGDLGDLDIDRENINEKQKDEVLSQISQGMTASDVMKLYGKNQGLAQKLTNKIQAQASTGDKEALEKIEVLSNSEFFQRQISTTTKQKTKETKIQGKKVDKSSVRKIETITTQEIEERKEMITKKYNNLEEPVDAIMIVEDHTKQGGELAKTISSASLESFKNLQASKNAGKEMIAKMDKNELNEFAQELIKHKGGQEKLAKIFNLRDMFPVGQDLSEKGKMTVNNKEYDLSNSREREEVNQLNAQKAVDVIKQAPTIAVNLAGVEGAKGLTDLQGVSKEIAEAIIQAIANQANKGDDQAQQLIPNLKNTAWIKEILEKQKKEAGPLEEGQSETEGTTEGTTETE